MKDEDEGLTPCSHALRGNTLVATLRGVPRNDVVLLANGRGASTQCVPTRSVGTR